MTTCKLIGRKASPCKKCSVGRYFVNSLGGIQCESCSPPQKPSDVTTRVRIDCGVWVPVDFTGDANSLAASPQRNEARAPATTSATPAKPVDAPLTHIQLYFINLAASDEIWNSPDQWVFLRRKPRISTDDRPLGAFRTNQRVSPPNQPLPAVGTQVSVPRRIPLFGKVIRPGAELVISAAWNDRVGNAVVNLSRDDRVVVSAIVWPIRS